MFNVVFITVINIAFVFFKFKLSSVQSNQENIKYN